MHDKAPLVTNDDIEAAKQLLLEAGETADVADLREMLFDQNGGNTTITTETGETHEVSSIGSETFAELGQKAVERAIESLPQSDPHWRNKD